MTVLEDTDFHGIAEHVAKLQPAILLDNSNGYRLHRELGIPLVRVGQESPRRSSESTATCRPLRGPLVHCGAGTELTATLHPEEIILALAPAEHISAQNQMPGRSKTVVENDGRVWCCVDVGTDPFVDVTHYSTTGLTPSAACQAVCQGCPPGLRLTFG